MDAREFDLEEVAVGPLAHAGSDPLVPSEGIVVSGEVRVIHNEKEIKMAEQHKYVHVDPRSLPRSDRPPYQGSATDCLADALCDVVDAGLSVEDVGSAMVKLGAHVAKLNGDRFKVHHGA